MNALARTATDLTAALTVFTCRGRPEAIDRAIADIDRRTPRVVADFAAATRRDELEGPHINLMVAPAGRWQITRAVYGLAHESIWPPRPGMTATDVLAECARRIEGQKAFRAAGHYCYDADRLVALRQAEVALLRIIMEDRP